MLLNRILSDYGTFTQKIVDCFTMNMRLTKFPSSISRKDLLTAISFLLHKRFIICTHHKGATYYNLVARNIERRLYFTHYVELVNRNYGKECSSGFMKALASGISEIHDKIFVMKMVNAGVMRIVDKRILEGVVSEDEDARKKAKIESSQKNPSFRKNEKSSKIIYECKEENERAGDDTDLPRQYVIVDYKRLEGRLFVYFISEYFGEIFDTNLKHIFDISSALVNFSTKTILNCINDDLIILKNSSIENLVNRYLEIMKGAGIIEFNMEGNYKYNLANCRAILKDHIVTKLASHILCKESIRIFNHIKEAKQAEDKDLVRKCLLESDKVQKLVFNVYTKGLVQIIASVSDGRQTSWAYDRKKVTYALAGYIEELICQKWDRIDQRWDAVDGSRLTKGDDALFLNDFLYLCKIHFILKYEE